MSFQPQSQGAAQLQIRMRAALEERERAAERVAAIDAALPGVLSPEHMRLMQTPTGPAELRSMLKLAVDYLDERVWLQQRIAGLDKTIGDPTHKARLADALYADTLRAAKEAELNEAALGVAWVEAEANLPEGMTVDSDVDSRMCDWSAPHVVAGKWLMQGPFGNCRQNARTEYTPVFVMARSTIIDPFDDQQGETYWVVWGAGFGVQRHPQSSFHCMPYK
jgi:hypothetical protein